MADQLAGGLRQLLGALTGGNTGPTTPIHCAALNAPVAKGIMHPDLILDDRSLATVRRAVDGREDVISDRPVQDETEAQRLGEQDR